MIRGSGTVPGPRFFDVMEIIIVLNNPMFDTMDQNKNIKKFGKVLGRQPRQLRVG